MSRSSKIEFWAGVSAFLVIVSALIGMTLWLAKTLVNEDLVPFTGVIIQGERQYTADSDVVQVLTQTPVGSFFAADAEYLRQRLETLPWVYSVSVRKEWPSTLRVFIVEQVPVAIWNGTELLNQDGERFVGEVERVRESLPKLEGPNPHVAEVFRQYRDIQLLLARNNHNIERFILSERFATRVWLTSGIELRLGRESQLERVQRFMDLLPTIEMESTKGVAYVDLRYDTGLAVGWHETQPGE
ncbi:cell division protein FtsQ/DivIB [Aliidiomarina celeris]|uniref:cell division protein FtsQ/DivIB n=1 Tax=Aliidiomarina celeris TaxID=2249428 RepID=UPI000DE8CB4A|nr:cell division protein FtsQ/DivIB [Aliidiomarina celeris]